MIAIEVKGGGQAHNIHSIREILLVTQYLMNLLYSLYFGCGGSEIQIINRECGNAPFRKAVNSSL